MKKIVFALIALLPTTSAFSANCDNAQTQLEMNQCAAQSYQKIDAELTAIYKKLSETAKDEQRNMLQTSQKKWIEFRDADCKFLSSGVEGGSAHSMILSNCLASMTESRIETLKSVLNCEEGDLSCPRL